MSEAAPAGPAADRNLLFGILAVQMDFVSRDALITAMNAWVLAKHRPLGELLQEQGALTPQRRALLDGLADEHLHAHGGDPRCSLAALAHRSTVDGALQSVADPDLQATLAAATRTLPTAGDPGPAADGTRYRVLRPHAQGGLGVVSVARDAELGREVALKELQADHWTDPASRGRFVREAEITGGLEHPGVVPVYGLGRYADGRPYYAMRLVRGETLQEAARKLHAGEPGYTLRGLLTRFVAVCNAVAYAHSRGVIHRDLKPANVMLGPFGETLVVDWGLAKVVGRGPAGGEAAAEVTLRPASADGAETLVGAALGTPAFMSPEQARGEVAALGPATDVYSLGATLYAVLAGQPPVQGRNTTEVLEKVRQGDWPPPRQVKSSVPKALDAVCRKAMALHPRARYGSALGLTADVEHWLAGETVSAYREPWPARARRWARRHRTPVATAAAAAVVALVLGGAGLVWQQREQARRRAAAEAALGRVLELQSKSRWPEAKVALEQAAERLGEPGCEDLRPRLDEPRRELELVERLDKVPLERASRLRGSNFDYAASDRGYAAAFGEAGLGAPGDDPDAVAGRVAGSAVREALVAALDDWALAAPDGRRAWVLEVARRADPDPGRDGLRDPAAWGDEQELADRALKAHPEKVTPGLAAAVGRRLHRAGRGEEFLRAAQFHRPGDFWLNVALGNVLDLKGYPAEAEKFYRMALAVRPDSAAVHVCIGVELENRGQIEQAAAYYDKARRLDPDCAPAYIGLGVVCERRGKTEEAADDYRKAIVLDPDDPLARRNLGVVLDRQGKWQEAADSFRAAIKLDSGDAESRDRLPRVLKKMAVAPRLPAVLRGADRPADPAEGLAFAELCADRQRYADAARLYADAFAADPKAADDLRAGYRYDAACSAAQVGCGKRDGAPADDEGRARWRRQALAWLRSDLALSTRQLAGGPAEKAEAAKRLRNWLGDEDFVGVRGAAGLAELPQAERKEWESLWAEVRAQLADPPGAK